MIKYKLPDLLVWMAVLPGQFYIDKIISLNAFQKLTVSYSNQTEFVLNGKGLISLIIKKCVCTLMCCILYPLCCLNHQVGLKVVLRSITLSRKRNSVEPIFPLRKISDSTTSEKCFFFFYWILLFIFLRVLVNDYPSRLPLKGREVLHFTNGGGIYLPT